MKNIKQKLRRSVLYLLGFSAFPLLTSCYGTPQDYHYPEPELEGKILTTDQQPIEGILISVTTDYGPSIQDYSDYNGEYTISDMNGGAYDVVFSDIDGDANGGDFEQQSKTVEEISANGKVTMKLKNAASNE